MTDPRQVPAIPQGTDEQRAAEGNRLIGQRIPQIDAHDKVTGRARYTDDLRLHNPLWVKILRSPCASARIRRLDDSRARSMAGVRAVLTGADFERRFGVLPISRDEPVIARQWVNYVGEPVAAVAAETLAEAEAALDSIEIEYVPDTPGSLPGFREDCDEIIDK